MRRADRFAAIGVCALVLTFGGAAAAHAYDFGFTLDNTSAVSFSGALSSVSLTQQDDTLSAWFSTHFGPRFELYAQGSYQFTLDRYYLFDVDLLYLNALLSNRKAPQALSRSVPDASWQTT